MLRCWMANIEEIKLAAEQDLETFVRLVAPHECLSDYHTELYRWWTRDNAKPHQLALVPRDHGKSRAVAYRVAWEITRRPDVRVLYISATSNLAVKQLKFIKDILSSKIYRRYWPEMLNESVHDREKWSETEISVDHPKRKAEAVRDPTVFVAGLTTSITGLHCDVAVLDDVVVQENAYTKDGREKVQSQYSLLSSIEGANSQEWVVGTRYHPQDLYQSMLDMKEQIYDKDLNIIDEEPVFEIFERKVEDKGDGTGTFLWPIQKRHDGKVFGFSPQILAGKRAKYKGNGQLKQFYAQYYNDPTRGDGAAVNRDKFQYYDKKFLDMKGGIWYYNGKRINVYAAIDFAFSLKKKADFTAIVVIGIDCNHNIYVLDIDRFKTDSIATYFEKIRDLFIKWDFRKLRAEVTSAQSVVVKQLKDNYIKPNGLAVSVDEYKPNRHEGSKEERLEAILSPRYENMQIWHYKGGECSNLEDELIVSNPPHDDIKDALASAIEISIPPAREKQDKTRTRRVKYNTRFGGVV